MTVVADVSFDINGIGRTLTLDTRTTLLDALRERLKTEIQHYYDDVHGAPAWRRHMTLQFAEEIRRELAGEGPQ